MQQIALRACLSVALVSALTFLFSESLLSSLFLSPLCLPPFLSSVFLTPLPHSYLGFGLMAARAQLLKLQQEEDGHACVLKGADGESLTAGYGASWHTLSVLCVSQQRERPGHTRVCSGVLTVSHLLLAVAHLNIPCPPCGTESIRGTRLSGACV